MPVLSFFQYDSSDKKTRAAVLARQSRCLRVRLDANLGKHSFYLLNNLSVV